MFSVLLQVSLAADRSQRSADILQCAEDVDKTAPKWSMEETCKFVFVVYSVLVSLKNAFCFSFNIFDARNINPAAAMRVSSFSSPFSLMYSFTYSCPLNVDKMQH